MDTPELIDSMRTWRRHLHQHPEFGFEEAETARFVAEKLREFGFDEIETGVGGTGVVATLRRGTGDRTIALRADMDCLQIEETTNLPYASSKPGLMHACGHDGHTTILLGAAATLARDGGFDGTVRFVFQPAEEWGQGMKAMIRDGLGSRLPFDEIYGLHNKPGLPVGSFETRTGAYMGAEDGFRIDPAELAVVSVTAISGDNVVNAIAGEARISGDCRHFDDAVSQRIEAAMRRIATGIAAAHDCTVEIDYDRVFVPLVNAAEPAAHALDAARQRRAPQRRVRFQRRRARTWRSVVHRTGTTPPTGKRLTHCAARRTTGSVLWCGLNVSHDRRPPASRISAADRWTQADRFPGYRRSASGAETWAWAQPQ